LEARAQGKIVRAFRLSSIVPAVAMPPESLDVGWFTEQEAHALENRDPATNIDLGLQFEFFGARAFEFIQQTG
jgi:hypothetical protein